MGDRHKQAQGYCIREKSPIHHALNSIANPRYSHKHKFPSRNRNLQLELFDPFPRLLDSGIHLVRIGTLADRRRSLPAGLAADDRGDLLRPLGSNSALGRKRLYDSSVMIQNININTTHLGDIAAVHHFAFGLIGAKQVHGLILELAFGSTHTLDSF